MSPEERSRLDRCKPSKAQKAPMVTQQTHFDIPIQPTGWILTCKTHTQDQMIRPPGLNGLAGGVKRISTSRPITALNTHRMKAAVLKNRS
ncbi:hypothetical protein B447_12434 [Thauera sp. 27]|nr:hypothetical protein B447_12434 [Thauera sp. 27]